MKDINGVRSSAASNLHLDFMALTLELNMFFFVGVDVYGERGVVGVVGGASLKVD